VDHPGQEVFSLRSLGSGPDLEHQPAIDQTGQLRACGLGRQDDDGSNLTGGQPLAFLQADEKRPLGGVDHRWSQGDGRSAVAQLGHPLGQIIQGETEGQQTGIYCEV
jgi:hypothetical protein